MTRKFLLAFFVLTLSWNILADNRRQELLNLVNEELQEVARLNNQIGSRNPDLLLRIAELYLEKARIYKEVENERFLKLDPKTRARVNKKKFFNDSRKYFIKAQKTCLYILKRFRRYKGKADVYYILAFNAKEFNQIKRSKRYFRLAVKHSGRKSNAKEKSQIALAEMHYNNREYRQAEPLYRSALSGKKTKWWTKDAFNWAWTLFRLKRYRQAISVMKEIERLSKAGGYIDMSQQVERDLAYFYVDMGRPKDAIQYYKAKGQNLAGNMLKIAKHLAGQGKFTSTESVLLEALNHPRSEKEDVEIRFMLLNTYNKYGRVSKHLETAKILYQKRELLDPAELEVLTFQVKKNAAELQKQVASKRYKRLKKSRAVKARLAVEYFDLLSLLDPKKAYEYAFLAAETLYADEKFNEALSYYERAAIGSKAAGDAKIRRLSLNSMMASLGEKGISKANQDKYLIPFYILYLKAEPRSKKSFKVYQRLFSEQFSKGDLKGAEATLLAFKANFPKAIKTQEAMVAKLMDYHKNKGDKQGIEAWVKRINSGEFVVTKKYANKLKALLLTMQFENVENANTKGQKKQALLGYLHIYKNNASSKDAKMNSAYNIAVLFHELRDPNMTYRWTERALDLMSPSDVRKFESSFLAIISDLFARNRFAESGALFAKVIEKLCNQRSRNKKVFYKNAIVVYLANDQYKQAQQIYNLGRRCGIPRSIRNEMETELGLWTVEKSQWDEFKAFYRDNHNDSSLWSTFILGLSKMAIQDPNETRQYEQEIDKLYRGLKAKRKKIPLKVLDIVARIRMKALDADLRNLHSMQLKFPEKTFNTILQQKFKQLDRVTTAALRIFETGSGKGIVEGYKKLVEAYESFANEINAFTPPGKSEEYVSSFKQGMSQLTKPLSGKANDFRLEARNQIKRHKILSPYNSWFLINSRIPFYIQHFNLRNGTLMDRSGG